MKRIFITTIPLQFKNALQKLIYQPVGFQFSKKERETSFPIIPVIAENLENKEEIEIIAIRTINKDTADNYDQFLEEVKSLNLEESCVKVVEMPEQQNMETQINLFMDIIDQIPNHSSVNACITYGTKPVSVIVTYVLTALNKIFTDIEVEGIYYGEIVREKNIVKEARIYDLVGLLMVENIIEQIHILEMDHPKESLKRLLNLH